MNHFFDTERRLVPFIGPEQRLALVDGQLQMAEKFPYTALDAAQASMLDWHLREATLSARNCESMRDPLERKHIGEVVAKLYASLDLPPPTVYILGSPMSCAFAWSHTPQTPADRWRVFHDEFYTHPLSSTLVDVISDGYNAFTRLVDHSISTSMTPMLSTPIRQDYTELERVGELVATAITSMENPLQNAELTAMFRKEIEANIDYPAIRDSVQRQVIPNLTNLFLPTAIFRGQQYAQTAYYQAMSELGMPFVGYHKNLISLWQQMNKACHWWFPYKNVLLLSDRPSGLHVDERGRPHNPKGAAIEYRDGWKVYAWKGILIPKNIVESPEKLTVSDIIGENNTEIRRAMVDVFGIDRFVVESHSKQLDQQGEYELLEVPYLDGGNMVALKMRCPTTFAVYVHTVHPECTNVEQALAWKRGEDDFRNARPYKEGLLWEK
jgi:hypothetical protein